MVGHTPGPSPAWTNFANVNKRCKRAIEGKKRPKVADLYFVFRQNVEEYRNLVTRMPEVALETRELKSLKAEYDARSGMPPPTNQPVDIDVLPFITNVPSRARSTADTSMASDVSSISTEKLTKAQYTQARSARTSPDSSSMSLTKKRKFGDDDLIFDKIYFSDSEIGKPEDDDGESIHGSMTIIERAGVMEKGRQRFGITTEEPENEVEETEYLADDEIPIGVVRDDTVVKRIVVASLNADADVILKALNMNGTWHYVSVTPGGLEWKHRVPRRVDTFETLKHWVTLNSKASFDDLPALKGYILHEMGKANPSKCDKLGWKDGDDIRQNGWLGHFHETIEKFRALSFMPLLKVPDAIGLVDNYEKSLRKGMAAFQEAIGKLDASKKQKDVGNMVFMACEAEKQYYQSISDVVHDAISTRRSNTMATIPDLPGPELDNLGMKKDQNGKRLANTAKNVRELMRDMYARLAAKEDHAATAGELRKSEQVVRSIEYRLDKLWDNYIRELK